MSGTVDDLVRGMMCVMKRRFHGVDPCCTDPAQHPITAGIIFRWSGSYSVMICEKMGRTASVVSGFGCLSQVRKGLSESNLLQLVCFEPRSRVSAFLSLLQLAY